MTGWTYRPTRSQRLAAGAAALLALGAAGGAGAVSLTRPAVEMAPAVATPIAKLGSASGVVTVRGRVAAVYGNRLLVQDASGRTLVDAGRRSGTTLAAGSPVLVQGRYDDGQLRARFLVDRSGTVEEVGPGRPPHADGPPPPPPHGPGAPPPGCAVPPPPPPGGAPAPMPGAAPGPNGAPAGPPAPPRQ